VVANMLHYTSNQPAMIAFEEATPVRFGDLQLLTCFLTAQRRAKLGHHSILDQGRRHRLRRTRIPSVLSCRLTDVVAKPPSPVGRVSSDHRPLAALAEQEPSQ